MKQVLYLIVQFLAVIFIMPWIIMFCLGIVVPMLFISIGLDLLTGRKTGFSKFTKSIIDKIEAIF